MEDLLQPLPVLWVRLSSCRTRLTTTSSAPTSKAPHCGRRTLGACTRSRIRFGTSCARPLVERDQLQKRCAYNCQANLWPHLSRFSCSSRRWIYHLLGMSLTVFRLSCCNRIIKGHPSWSRL